MSDSEPLAASLDEASARLLSMRLRELEARMDKFDGHKAVILSNMERLDIVEVELEGLKKRAAESLPVGVLGKQQDGPATDGEGKAADKCGGIVSSRATGSEGSAGDPMPSFASMSTSGPVADSFGQLVAAATETSREAGSTPATDPLRPVGAAATEPPKSTLEVLEGLAGEAMEDKRGQSEGRLAEKPYPPSTPQDTASGGIATTESDSVAPPEAVATPKKRGRPKGSKNKPKQASPPYNPSDKFPASPTTSPETEGVPW